MERKVFIRNIVLACIAVKVPLKWIPPVIEEGGKGIIRYINNQPVTIVNYNPGDFSFKDLLNMIEEERKKPRLQRFYWWDYQNGCAYQSVWPE
jgi:hypothetical protein